MTCTCLTPWFRGPSGTLRVSLQPCGCGCAFFPLPCSRWRSFVPLLPLDRVVADFRGDPALNQLSVTQGQQVRVTQSKPGFLMAVLDDASGWVPEHKLETLVTEDPLQAIRGKGLYRAAGWATLLLPDHA